MKSFKHSLRHNPFSGLESIQPAYKTAQEIEKGEKTSMIVSGVYPITPSGYANTWLIEEEGNLMAVDGDTILNLRGRGELNAFCSHPEDIQRSSERLLERSVETICPGHGKAIIGVPDVLRGMSRRGV